MRIPRLRGFTNCNFYGTPTWGGLTKMNRQTINLAMKKDGWKEWSDRNAHQRRILRRCLRDDEDEIRARFAQPPAEKERPKVEVKESLPIIDAYKVDWYVHEPKDKVTGLNLLQRDEWGNLKLDAMGQPQIVRLFIKIGWSVLFFGNIHVEVRRRFAKVARMSPDEILRGLQDGTYTVEEAKLMLSAWKNGPYAKGRDGKKIEIEPVYRKVYIHAPMYRRSGERLLEQGSKLDPSLNLWREGWEEKEEMKASKFAAKYPVLYEQVNHGIDMAEAELKAKRGG